MFIRAETFMRIYTVQNLSLNRLGAPDEKE